MRGAPVVGVAAVRRDVAGEPLEGRARLVEPGACPLRGEHVRGLSVAAVAGGAVAGRPVGLAGLGGLGEVVGAEGGGVEPRSPDAVVVLEEALTVRADPPPGAGVAAGAAVGGVDPEVDLAAGVGVVVAVGVAGVAHREALPHRAGHALVLPGAAHVAAGAAVLDVGGGVHLAAVGRLLVAVGERGVAQVEPAYAALADVDGVGRGAGGAARAAVGGVALEVDAVTAAGAEPLPAGETARPHRADVALLAGHVAAGAVVAVTLEVDAGAVAIDVSGVALEVADPDGAPADTLSFGGGAHIAAGAAVERVGGEVHLAAVGGVLVAVGEAGVARGGGDVAPPRRADLVAGAGLAAGAAVVGVALEVDAGPVAAVRGAQEPVPGPTPPPPQPGAAEGGADSAPVGLHGSSPWNVSGANEFARTGRVWFLFRRRTIFCAPDGTFLL